MKSIFDEEYRRLIKRLKQTRLNSGLSQKDLSDLLGHSQSYISKIEQGQIRLDVVQLKQIAKALKINFQDLMGK